METTSSELSQQAQAYQKRREKILAASPELSTFRVQLVFDIDLIARDVFCAQERLDNLKPGQCVLVLDGTPIPVDKLSTSILYVSTFTTVRPCEEHAELYEGGYPK